MLLVLWFLIPTLCVFHICEPSFEVRFSELLRYATFGARWQKGQSLFVHRHKIHFMSCSRRIFQVITGHNTSAYQIWAAHKKGCQLGLSDVSIVTCNFQCRCHRFAQSASSMRWDSLLHTCSRSSRWLTKWISTTEHLSQSSLSLTDIMDSKMLDFIIFQVTAVQLLWPHLIRSTFGAVHFVSQSHECDFKCLQKHYKTCQTQHCIGHTIRLST